MAAATLSSATALAGVSSAPAAAAVEPAQVAGIRVEIDAKQVLVRSEDGLAISGLTPLTDPSEGSGQVIGPDGVRFNRGADSAMYRVALADGQTFTVFVPAAAANESDDHGLAYAHSQEATRLAWNPLAWPDGTKVLLARTPLAVHLDSGSALLAGIAAGTVVQFTEPYDAEFVAYADRVADAMPSTLAGPTAEETARWEAALASAPSTAPPELNAAVLAIVPTPEQYVSAKDIVACADIPADDPTGQCPADVASADPAVIWQPDFSTTSALAVPVPNVIMTRPVFKAFIPEPSVDVFLGGCDFSKNAETFLGDARGPGADQPSARTTAFWDLSWGPNTGNFLRRIGETVRALSVSRLGQLTGTERRTQSADTIQGSPGIHYVTGAGAVEGFREVRFKVASANPFCSDALALAINQNNGQVGGTSPMFANRPPFWQKDGSMGTGFRHDAYPAHEYYAWSYLPGLRVTNPMQYYSPPNSRFGPLCLASPFFCQSIRVDIVSP